MNDIPFMVPLKAGAYPRIPITFNGEIFHVLNYGHLCHTGTEIMAFRLKEDAELAAMQNGWKYIGGPIDG